MKICYLAGSRIPSLEANSVQVMKMCAAFAELGHTVTLFAKKNRHLNQEPYNFYGVKPIFELYYMGMRPKRRGRIAEAIFGRRLRKAVKPSSPDLIYSRHPLALRAVASLGLPFVLEAHRLSEESYREEGLFRRPNFSRLVVITKALKEDYLTLFPSLDESKVLIAPDGADATLANPNERSASEGFTVGYVGQLYGGKGMEIISELPALCPWAHFHIVGGREEDMIFWRSRLVSKPNITLHGFVPHRDTGAFVNAFDVVLAPYQRRVETGGGFEIGRWMSPLKVFEYMSHGKAIIASDLPVLREVLEDGRNALLVPPSDPDSWAKAIKVLCDDAPFRERLGQQALKDFNEKYSWFRRARSVLDGLDVCRRQSHIIRNSGPP